jgi:hypothetical protein
MAAACDDCGRVQRTPLRPVRPVLTRIFVCDACYQRRVRRNLLSVVLIALLPAALAVPSSGPGPIVAVLVFIACFPLALVVHEAGHALVGRAVGIRIRGVELGLGRRLAGFHIGGTPVVVRALPVIGKVYFGGGPRRRARMRLLAAVAAGPAASAGVFLVGGWLVPMASLSAGLVVAGGLQCLGSLWPRRRSPALGLPTDGYQIGTLIRATADGVTTRVAAGWAGDVLEAYGQSRLQEAEQRLDRADAECPGNLTLAVLRAALLADVRPEEGLAAFRRMLDRAAEAPMRAAVLNGIAWSALLTWDPDLLAEADRASAEAFALAPTNAGVWDTRGLALIRTGRPQEGVELAERLLGAPLAPRSRAYVRCIVALGRAALGELIAADGHLEQARGALPADDLLLRRVSEGVASAVPAGV